MGRRHPDELRQESSSDHRKAGWSSGLGELLRRCIWLTSIDAAVIVTACRRASQLGGGILSGDQDFADGNGVCPLSVSGTNDPF